MNDPADGSIVLVTEEAIPPVYRFSLTQRLAEELAARGARVHLVCVRGDGAYSHPGVLWEPVDVPGWDLFRLAKRAEANLRLAARVRALCRRGGVRLVYGWWPILFFARGRGLVTAADMPEFLDVMYRNFHKPLAPLAAPLLRSFQTRVARRAALVVNESEAAREVWAGRGVARAKTHALPYGVEVERFAAGAPEPGFRESLGIATEEPLLLFHGDIGRDDGIEVLMQATEGIAAKVVIVGDGDPAYLAGLRGHAHAGVVFTGWIPYRRMPGILAHADLYLAPFLASAYTDTTFPLKFMEALAARRPLVVSGLRSLRGTLRDGHDCRLVPPGDAAALRRAIAGLLADPVQRARLGEEGQRTARRLFDFRRRTAVEAGLLLELARR